MSGQCWRQHQRLGPQDRPQIRSQQQTVTQRPTGDDGKRHPIQLLARHWVRSELEGSSPPAVSNSYWIMGNTNAEGTSPGGMEPAGPGGPELGGDDPGGPRDLWIRRLQLVYQGNQRGSTRHSTYRAPYTNWHLPEGLVTNQLIKVCVEGGGHG